MTASRWYGFISSLSFGLLYTAGAVWSHVHNDVMMGVLVGDEFAGIWICAAALLLCLGVAFVPGWKLRLFTFAAFAVALVEFGLGYKLMQENQLGWPHHWAWSIIAMNIGLVALMGLRIQVRPRIAFQIGK